MTGEKSAVKNAVPWSAIKLAVVCPMANEERNAVQFVQAVLERCTGFKQVRFLAILDKACRDNTLNLLHDLQKLKPELAVIYAPENKNVVDAYVRGYREALLADSDWILEIDAGFSHQPEDMLQFFRKMSEGYECVFGSRFAPGGRMEKSPLSRFMLSYGGSKLIQLLLGTRLSDMTSGFELFNRQSLSYVLEQGIHSRGNFFQTEIKVHCHKFKIAEVPIHYQATASRVSGAVIMDALRNLARLTRQRFVSN